MSEEQRARQASASLGGHLFQATRATSEWVRLAPDARLLIEVAEDYATLTRGALAMTQVKHEFSASLTLRSDGVRKALTGLVDFRDKNPELSVTLVYLTTAEPGREAGADLPGGTTGIAYWRDVGRGADVEPLRKLLLETQHDDALLQLLNEADDETLRTVLIQPVTWLTGTPGLPQATAALEAQLRSLGVERTGYSEDGERALPFLIHRILCTAVAESRVLTRDDFEKEWARATTVPASVTMMRRISTMVGDGSVPKTSAATLPPLSARLAARRPLVDELLRTLNSTDVLWIHGSSGLGKSQLARLMAARGNGRWEFVPLKGCGEAECANRLRAAIAGILHDDFAGLILDDIPVPASEGLRHWIGAVALEIAAAPSARIVVTSEREPLPQIRSAFEPLRITVHDAPYLEQDDVRDIVTASNGDADTWAKLVYLTCGNGHPLLVDARIAGLASKGWPTNERMQGLFEGEPSEVADVRREVSLRLLNELSPDAHQLLLRLSALIGAFDRGLVDAVARIEPAIARAGPLFEYLVGPWIELERSNRYTLSPLLAAAATALADDERNAIHRAAVDVLIKRSPFPAEFMSSLVIYSMLVRHLGGFVLVAQAIVGSEHRAEIASLLTPLLFMKPGKNGLLVPEHPGVSAMLRTAQVFAAVHAPSSKMVEPILEAAFVENATLPPRLCAVNMFMNLTAVLGSEAVDLPPAAWVPLLAKFRNMVGSGEVPEEMLELMDARDFAGLTKDQLFFVLRSKMVDTITDLEALFAELEIIDPVWRRALLAAAPQLLGGPPLFVQMAWSLEVKAKTLDAVLAEQSFTRLAEQAILWGEEEIAIECIRSRVVMLDEYSDRHEEALSVLDEADERFGRNDRLIRSRATVLATMGRHEEESVLLSSLGDDYSKDKPLERLLMLRTAAIAAGKLSQFEEAAQLFRKALEVARLEDPLTLGVSVTPGLLLDAATMEIRANQLAAALSSLVGALELIENSAASTDPSLGFARVAVEHVSQWASARIEGRSFPGDPSATPGICSTLRPTYEPDEADPRKPNQGWYLLAKLETLSGIDAGVTIRLYERERIDGVQLNLAFGLGVIQIESAIGRADADAIFSLLPRQAWLTGLRFRGRLDPKVGDVAHSFDAQIEPAQWGEGEILFARMAVSGLIGILLAYGRIDDAVAAAARARNMSATLAKLLPETETEQPPEWDFFASGIATLRRFLGDEQWSAETLLQASASLFIWLKQISASKLDDQAHAIVKARWLDLAGHQRSILSNPRLAVPAIEAAAELKPGIAAIARLIEAASLASSLNLPEHVNKMLKDTV